MSGIVIRDNQGNLFGGPKAGEESELVIVALRLAPVSVKGRDQHLSVLNAKRIDRWSILLANSGAFECGVGIDSLGIIEVSKVERPPPGTDRVVVATWLGYNVSHRAVVVRRQIQCSRLVFSLG
jgi:hypothetical protein